MVKAAGRDRRVGGCEMLKRAAAVVRLWLQKLNVSGVAK